MDGVRKLIRDKALEKELSLAWLSRQIGRNPGYLFDFLKGTPRVLPEAERGILADRLGISEDYLRPREAPEGGMPTVECERVEINSIHDTRLRETLRREVKKGIEIWRVLTPYIEAKYPPGTLVVIDTGATAHENDYVQAEIKAPERAFILRKYIPPNLITAVVTTPGVRGLTVDRERVIIRGVIRIGFR